MSLPTIAAILAILFGAVGFWGVKLSTDDPHSDGKRILTKWGRRLAVAYLVMMVLSIAALLSEEGKERDRALIIRDAADRMEAAGAECREIKDDLMEELPNAVRIELTSFLAPWSSKRQTSSRHRTPNLPPVERDESNRQEKSAPKDQPLEKTGTAESSNEVQGSVQLSQSISAPEETPTPPKLIYSPQPKYTKLAKKMRVQGVFRANLEIDQTGAVREVTVVKDLPMGLGLNAIKSLKEWKFEPAMASDGPVPSIFTAEVNFTMQ
ncbi:MAG: energy transducer TonB [Deltaproteobacteria bacterium]|nr:energy transducer TonB [Deltaproteobacteria bacterium]